MTSSANRRLRDRGLEKHYFDLVLVFSNEIRQHYCMFCRFGLFKSQHRAVMMAPSLGDNTMPATQLISLQCPDCGVIYRIGVTQ